MLEFWEFGRESRAARLTTGESRKLEVFGYRKSIPTPSNETLAWNRGEGSFPPKLLLITMILN